MSPGLLCCLVALLGLRPAPAGEKLSLLNVSYDATREFYAEYNPLFASHWLRETGREVEIRQLHGGSSSQSRAVIDGLEADVVTLAVPCDIDAIAARAHLVERDWQARLPHHSAPYTSTIVFVVRRGNPKRVRDWGDLVKPGIEVITPNPKTSGGARWNYLAAWGFALNRVLGDVRRAQDPAAAGVLKAAQPRAREFVAELYRHVPVLDQGARGASGTFAQKGIGDVLLAWESEAYELLRECGSECFEIVVPSLSILAEPPVAVVDEVAQKHGAREVAQAYLEFLYTPAGQALAARHFFRPVRTEGVAAEDLARFPKLELFTLDEVFGDWAGVQKEHFEDGGVFDLIRARTRSGTPSRPEGL